MLVSAATVWEIGIKRSLGKLVAPDDVVGAVEAAGLDGIPVTLAERAVEWVSMMGRQAGRHIGVDVLTA